MAENKELKSCPFCGGDAEIRTEPLVDMSLIHCINCDAMVSFVDNERKDRLIKAWNRRTEV